MTPLRWLVLPFLITACRATLVTDEKPVVSLQLATALELGESATITWHSSNADRCRAGVQPEAGGGAWVGGVSTSNLDGVRITPTNPGVYSYALTCDGPGGTGSAFRTVTVRAQQPENTITANPGTVLVGDSITLDWAFAATGTCEASGEWSGVRSATGREVVVADTVGPLTYTISCVGQSGPLTASAVVLSVSGQLSMTEVFSPNALTISTSEGAPYGDSDFWLGQDFQQSQFGYGPTKVVRIYVCLSGEVSYSNCGDQPPPRGPLSAEMLNRIEAGIAAYARTGIRLLVRFTYNWGPPGQDVPVAIIEQHIDQLAPILLRHRDLIFALQAGFIGAWGEWHTSSEGNDNPASRRRVLDREAFWFRNVFPILVRYPADLIEYAGSLQPPVGFGLHNDFFASDPTDGGTWIPRNGYSTRQLQDYAVAVSASGMFVAEFGALYPPLQSCAALNAYTAGFNPQSVSLYIWPEEVAAEIERQGCLLNFLNRIGTRIEVEQLVLTGEAVQGGQLHGTITLRNAGFGRVLRARPVTVVLATERGVLLQAQLPMEQLDLRGLLPSTSGTFDFDLVLPAAISGDEVTVSLLIPDPATSLRSDPAYALPLNSLAGTGRPVFNPVDGTNLLARFSLRRAVAAQFAGLFRPRSGHPGRERGTSVVNGASWSQQNP